VRETLCHERRCRERRATRTSRARGMTTERQMEVRKPSTRENTGGGERTRTAYFHVTNVFMAAGGGLWRTIRAAQRAIQTQANPREQQRPRDGRGMDLRGG
jgi:hypothetical protein